MHYGSMITITIVYKEAHWVTGKNQTQTDCTSNKSCTTSLFCPSC